MEILGFHQDEDGHWVAELACGHTRHFRHHPPFLLRPWVITPEGRASFVGREVTCVNCEVSVDKPDFGDSSE